MNQTATASPRFDSNRAWQEAAGAVAANREALVALAGLFIALPAFALTVLAPAPEPQAGADLDAMILMAEVYFREAWPGILLASLAASLGVMTMLSLIAHAARPTVGEAIRHGLATTPIALVAQILQGFMLTAIVLFAMTLGAITGSRGLAAVCIGIGVAVAAWLWVRTSLVTAVIAIENRRNPLAALHRAFTLSARNAGRLLLFFALLVVAFMIAGQLAQLAVTLIAQMVGGAEAGKLAGAFVASVVQAAMSVYFTAALATSHHQLSRPGE